MSKLLTLFLFLALVAVPVSAVELTAPSVPESGREFMPSTQDSFGAGLLEIFRQGIRAIRPDLREAGSVSLGILASVLMVSILGSFSGTARKTATLAGAIGISVLLLRSAGSMIGMGSQTVNEVSEYGKLLLPVMTTALAAQGGVTASAALYAGTLAFDTVLSTMISKLLTPLVYLFLALAVAVSAIGEPMLKKIQGSVKWFLTWSLKTILYVFTGYIGITGVISGSTDAAALKVAKLTISGAVPVVGGILSDAAEAVLVSAGTVKNAVGIYGMYAILAIWIGPFLRIGAHYLLLKATGALCSVIAPEQTSILLGDGSAGLGVLLG